jgi:hypothetical protein
MLESHEKEQHKRNKVRVRRRSGKRGYYRDISCQCLLKEWKSELSERTRCCFRLLVLATLLINTNSTTSTFYLQFPEAINGQRV